MKNDWFVTHVLEVDRRDVVKMDNSSSFAAEIKRLYPAVIDVLDVRNDMFSSSLLVECLQHGSA
jgi:hypothetical protein